ncbi:hypothetical protein RvY_03215 [Ramazzottius varieornatus]|uniref:BCS1 N-terminal domain-containing protein n=1 Tax=Ramazzottius varieornatus TaxID=947166 RepID=A0A1D1UR22_RAMVA|nr:hypothetical protein RvY_03215 [Ramazzottius varieornatus]
MVFPAALTNLIPQNLDFGGGFGLLAILAVVFPYIQRLALFFFKFNITENVSALFHESRMLGRLLGGNSVFGATVGVVGMGAIVAFLQKTWDYLKELYTEYFSISLEIPSHDSSYWDILEWIHEKQIKTTKKLSLQTGTRQTLTGKWQSQYDFIPAVGTHKFRFQGKKFQAERIRPEKTEDAAFSPSRSENVVLSAMGRDTSVFRHMLTEVKKFKEIKKEGKTMIYTAWQGNWQSSGFGKRKRPLNSVILDDGIAENILEDIEDFMNSAEWYTEFGVPYRRGYLLYGPPGTGKTSFISAVAGKFDLNVCIVNLSDKSLNDDVLNRLLIDAPENSLILLEGKASLICDRVFVRYGRVNIRRCGCGLPGA